MSRSDAVAALDAYAEDEYVRGEADQSATDQASMAAQAAALQLQAATIADLRAQVYALTPATVIPLKPFTDALSSGLSAPAGVRATSKTVYAIPALTSKAVPPTVAGSTNPLYLMRSGGLTAAGTVKGVDIGGFTLEGTDQGHAYGGLMLGYSDSAQIHDLVVTGVPGYSNGPPGETALLNLWRSTSAHLSNVRLDGRRTSDGVAVAATLLELNFTTGTTVIDGVDFRFAKYGFAAALWQCTGAVVFNNCRFGDSRKGVNIEQALAGSSYEFNGCDFRTLGSPYVTQVSSVGASVPVTYRDCTSDLLPSVRTYPGTGAELDSSIRWFVGDKDVTDDPTRFQIVHK